MQARVVATEFLLFIYLRATYMLAFLCRIPFSPYFTEIYTAIHKLLYTSVKSFNKHTKGIREQMNKATKTCTIKDITSINFNLAINPQIENYGISFEHCAEKF